MEDETLISTRNVNVIILLPTDGSRFYGECCNGVDQTGSVETDTSNVKLISSRAFKKDDTAMTTVSSGT